jgi:leader peptidase (prepilin peptidase)/N-methyltransferase
MDSTVSEALFIGWWAVLGLMVGSFLNVVIARLPEEGESVARPVRSRCPRCRTTLSWYENIPVLSWLALRARCRTCRAPISWRYPLVELLTGGLFLWVALERPEDPAVVALHSLVLAGLVVATFVDFDRYEIPDEVSLGGCVLAPLVSLALPRVFAADGLARALSEGAAVGRFEALAACLAGMALGGGILLAIGWLGKRIYGAEAMGLGDVKLMAAGGGLVGPGAVLYALLLAALLGSIVGVLNMLRLLLELRRRVRQRGRSDGWGRSLQAARLAGRYIPFGPYLAVGIATVLVRWEADGAALLRLLEP